MSIVAPKAARSPSAIPATLPSAPTRFKTSVIFGADAVVLLPKKFTLSASSRTDSCDIPKAVLHFAIVSPASSAVMSKAIPIFAASFAKSTKFPSMPACPAAATIDASPSCVIGISRDKF